MQFDTHLHNATPAQAMALHDLNMVLKHVEDMYNSRHHFNMKGVTYGENKILHHQIRISIQYDDLVFVETHDDEGNLVSYEENREDDFYIHFWYDRDGRIWFLINERGFPTFGKDIAYRGELNKEYDWIKTGYGSRRYFFGDVAFNAVKHNFIEKIRNGMIGHYVWNTADISIFNYFEDCDVSVYTD